MEKVKDWNFNFQIDKWQDQLWGPAQGLEKTLHTENILKN